MAANLETVEKLVTTALYHIKKHRPQDDARVTLFRMLDDMPTSQ